MYIIPVIDTGTARLFSANPHSNTLFGTIYIYIIVLRMYNLPLRIYNIAITGLYIIARGGR